MRGSVDSRLLSLSLTFGDALAVMKAGYRVARAGWNGKGMWIALTRASAIGQEQARAGAAAHLAKDLVTLEDKERAECSGCASGLAATSSPPHTCNPKRSICINAHIDMRAADGSLVIGWLASQTDMLAEDWMVVP